MRTKVDYNPEVLLLARRRLGMKQYEVAEKIKRARITVNRIEQGRHASEKTVREICDVLGVPYETCILT